MGLGTDLVEVERVRRSVERHGKRFLDRVFTPEEQTYCMDKANPYPHLAARFAAKEAVSKAFGTGIGADLKWKSVGVVHGARGEALVVLDELGAKLLAAVGADAVALTLSHTANHAQAVALLLRRS